MKDSTYIPWHREAKKKKNRPSVILFNASVGLHAFISGHVLTYLFLTKVPVISKENYYLMVIVIIHIWKMLMHMIQVPQSTVP